MKSHIAVAVALVVSSLLVNAAAAATIVSNNFSLGYGFTPSSWNTSETVSANTGVAY